MAQVGLGFSFMELFWVRWCSAGHQKCADTRGDLVLGAGLGEVGKSLILGLFYEFILVVFANSHFSSCTGCVQILVLFSVLGWFSKTSLGPDPSAVLAFTFYFFFALQGAGGFFWCIRFFRVEGLWPYTSRV